MTSRLALACLPLAALALALPAGEPPGADEWKYDVIRLKNGQSLRGLVIEETPSLVRIRCVTRKPGRPTVVINESVPRSETASPPVLLDPDERKRLAERLEALRRERTAFTGHSRLLDPGKKEPPPSDAFELTPTPWPGDDEARALGYRSTHFQLVSTARAAVTRFAAFHLEQISTAYAHILPPRAHTATPTTVLLTRSFAEYDGIRKDRRLELTNPAFYDPGRNQVVCGSNLDRLCDDLAATRAHHARLRADMKERRAELSRVYRHKVPRELLAPFAEAEKRIAASEKANDANFARAQRRLLQRLYHEAFHAYLGTFVYPAKGGSLPVWFNEGLAQVFETAVVEVGELRVSVPDGERLKAVRQALARGTLLSLADLLRAEPRRFQVAHVDDKQVSDSHYLASWALAFHLTFERRLLGTKALDDYVAALRRGTDPLLAFRDLVGVPLDQFEKEHRLYVQKLQPGVSAR